MRISAPGRFGLALGRADIDDDETLDGRPGSSNDTPTDCSPVVADRPHHSVYEGGAVIATTREAVTWSYGLLPNEYAPSHSNSKSGLMFRSVQKTIMFAQR